MPKISAVIVNYNYSKYLSERIESILNQTYRDFELIIIDNGSTDSSVQIIEQYTGDPRIRTCFFSSNDSPFRRWNDSVDLAVGDYFHIACSDDSCHPTFYEKLLEKLESNSSVGIAFTQSWGVDDEGNKLQLWKGWTDDLDYERWSRDFIDVGKRECQYLIFKNTIPSASGALLRRNTFIEAGKFDLGFKYAGDWMLWAKILMASDIAFIAEPLNYFRNHTSTASNTSRPILDLEERLKVIYYLSQQVEIPESFWEKVYLPTIGWWMRMMLLNNIPLSTNKRIYHTLKAINPNVNYQIIMNIISIFKRKLFSA